MNETPRPGATKDQITQVGETRPAAKASAAPEPAQKPAPDPAQAKAAPVPPQPQPQPQAKSQGKPQGKSAETPLKDKILVAPTVAMAALKSRHRAMALSFLFIVVLPVFLASFYLYTRAHDRYVSHVGFSVRSENTSSAMEMLGGLAEISGSSSSDTDILYNYIKSEELVRALDAKLDLRKMWAKAGDRWWHWGDDPWYAYHPGGTIEDLTDYWGRMVQVYSDSGTGLIDVEAQAFTPEDAHKLTQAIFDESSKMINRLSQIAREDKIRYARDELETAVQRLKTARAAMTQFRNENQIVDPQSLIEGQVGLLSSLQQQLAQSLIELDTLRQTTRDNDPRIVQTERRVQVISDRIAAERKKLGLSGTVGGAPASSDMTDGEGYANIVGQYESLAVDQQFAEQSYTAAMTAYDTAKAEANRQSRYLAAHIRPSMPEASMEPVRGEIVALLAIIMTMVWVLVVLVAYALRDRR
ncbi:capsule biosynthesis protein [Thioclava sp. GXIMD4215]|uniref:capsule biosynthesis protein n=1 Tax=Thioclava sp. GXIMD4215 TaxID=3131928 RepID=UPI00311ACC86